MNEARVPQSADGGSSSLERARTYILRTIPSRNDGEGLQERLPKRGRTYVVDSGVSDVTVDE